MFRKDGLRKPLWEWCKLNKLTDKEIPEKKVNIYNLSILDIKKYKIEYIVNDFMKKINNVKTCHNFRQNLIINDWKDIILKYGNIEIVSFKLCLTVSSGFYVRQFVKNISDKINYPLLVYDINRTKIVI